MKFVFRLVPQLYSWAQDVSPSFRGGKALASLRRFALWVLSSNATVLIGLVQVITRMVGLVVMVK